METASGLMAHRYTLAEIEGPHEDKQGVYWRVRIASHAARDFGYWDTYRPGQGLGCIKAPQYLIQQIEREIAQDG